MLLNAAAFFEQFLTTLPPESPYRTRAWHAEAWGDRPSMADALGALIAAGTKTATCSSLWEWQADGESPPEVGSLTVVVDGRGEALAVIELLESQVRRFCDVDAAFAWDEGEGDRSLEFWRSAHRRFFTAAEARTGSPFAETMPLVCERFRRIDRG